MSQHQHNNVGIFDRYVNCFGCRLVFLVATGSRVHVEGNYKRVCGIIKCGEILYAS